MANRFTYKNKFYAIVGVTLVLAVLVWLNGIKVTIELKNQCSQMENVLDSSKTSSEDIFNIKNQLQIYEELLGSETIKIEEINRGIMRFIGDRTQNLNLTLTEFPPVHEFSQNQYVIYTHQAEVEGRFNDILQLIYEFETNFKLAKVCGLKIHTKEDYRSHKKKLYALIYVQNIRTKN